MHNGSAGAEVEEKMSGWIVNAGGRGLQELRYARRGMATRRLAALAAPALMVIVLALAGAMPALAWNDEGHMAVAYLAYQRG